MRLLFIGVETVSAGVFLLPLLLLLNRFWFHNWKRTAAYFFFTLYLSAMWALVGLPTAAYMRFELNLNLIPLLGISTDLSNSFLNILLFIPLGFLLPLLWEDFRSPNQTIRFGLFTSCAIETLQILTFRASDVNDLITNTLGTGIGWILADMLLKKADIPYGQRNKNDLWLLIGCVFTVMFFFQPFLANAIWSIM